MTRLRLGEPVGLDAAKLAPPSLSRAIPRPRLELALESLHEPARWVCAPSGAGKSVLVASYVSRQSVPVHWYRLDERDNDPTFFFAQWTVLAERHLKPATPAPEFSYGDSGSPAAHARRLLRLLAERGPALLVFDDEQVISAPSMRDVLVELGCGGSDRVRSIFCSQQPPPEQFYGAISRRLMAVCWNLDLALNEADCSTLAAQYELSATQARELRDVCGGHAAAAVLACELLRATRSAKGSLQALSGGVHGFLLEQLIGRLPQRLRDLLLQTSYLPQLRLSLVQRVLPQASAEDLESLADQGLLVRHLVDGDLAYTAHDLVRVGARRIAGMAPGERCADALHDAGRHEEAFEVECLLERWARAGDALLAAAPSLVREQRITHLLRAAERLPDAELDVRPDLLLWCGQAALGIDLTVARRWLQRAHDRYCQADDRSGAALASACALIGYHTDMQEIQELDAWLERFALHEAAAEDVVDDRWRALLLLGRICEADLGATEPRDPQRTGRAADELMRLVRDEHRWPSADQRANAARLLFEHLRAFRASSMALQHAPALRAIAADAAVSPILRARWWLREARLHALLGDAAAEEQCMVRAVEVAEQSGSGKTQTEVDLQRLESRILGGHQVAAQEMLSSLEQSVAASPADCARFGRLVSCLLMLQGRYPEALARAESALEAAEAAGYRGANAREYVRDLVYALAAVGRFSEAAQRARELGTQVSGSQRELVTALAQSLEYLASGRSDRGLLKAAFSFAARSSWTTMLRNVPALADLCADALALGIERDFVTGLIKLRGLLPPAGVGSEWPWPVRLHTLGGFMLEVDGLPYRPAHKAQDKPLELLRLLAAAEVISHGYADRRWLCDRLWPDADPANARKSLDMTVSRLRKLLGQDGTVEWVDGRLRLSTSHVWLDVRWLLREVRTLHELRDAAVRAGVSFSAVDYAQHARVVRIINVYRGPFLHQEDLAAWQIGVRSQVAQLVRSAIVLLDVDRATASDELVLALERAFSTDTSAEDIARLLMQAYLCRGEASAALRVYTLLKESLGSETGAEPSNRVRELQQQAAARLKREGAPALGRLAPH